ncbi:MAG: hypothetical protein ABW185_19610 [Sedimenticola sp.]
MPSNMAYRNPLPPEARTPPHPYSYHAAIPNTASTWCTAAAVRKEEPGR